MENDFVQTILDAEADAISLSEFVWKPADFMVSRRLAPPTNTLNYYLEYLEGLKAVCTQETGVVNVNGVEVKTVTQAVKDALNSAAIDNNTQVDTLITATPKHIGSVARTQAEKNSDIVSVRDFGAVGDGVTDDTAAFEVALQHSKTPFVPDGNYIVNTSTVDIKSMWGVGTVSGVEIPFSRQIADMQLELDSKMGDVLGQLTPDYFNVQSPRTLIGNPSNLHDSPKVVGRNDVKNILGIATAMNNITLDNIVIEIGKFSVTDDTAASLVPLENTYKAPPWVFCQVVGTGALGEGFHSTTVFNRRISGFNVDVVVISSNTGVHSRVADVELLYLVIGEV